MPKSKTLVDARAAEAHLMALLAVEGQSGEEKLIGDTIIKRLRAIGVPASAISFDDAHRRIPLPTQTGNLFVNLPGTRHGERLVFATHMDVVPIVRGAKPKKSGQRIVPAGKTGLGGDNRTGCAVLVALAETLIRKKLTHPPITLLFTVREESGLQGAKYMDPKKLGGAKKCFNVDAKYAHELITGAVGAQSWEVEIHGKAAHAGVAPEKGISSMLVASIALAEAHRGGWWGKVVKGRRAGTSNAGIFAGHDRKAAGDATNVVTDYVFVRGETRSRDAKFAAEITAAYKKAFELAGRTVKDSSGGRAKVVFKGKAEYPPFELPKSDAAVQQAMRAVKATGATPKLLFSNGGLDANWFVRHGLSTVTFGAGQHEIHTVKEWVDIPEFIRGCELAVTIATLDE
ncbi:MAG: M20/M25/M40 family metallo-hydrolase [Phycisphaeraceae bacterium]|nr:M20/M25/M40 family metallo-hydrolase [Phycisphaeraceae bacterium]